MCILLHDTTETLRSVVSHANIYMTILLIALYYKLHGHTWMPNLKVLGKSLSVRPALCTWHLLLACYLSASVRTGH